MVQPADHTHGSQAFPMTEHFPADIDERFLGALKLYPQKEVYEGIAKKEQVVLVMRKHWITLVQPLLIGMVLALIPVILLGVILLTSLEESFQRYGIILVWYGFAFVGYYFLAVLLRYTTDVWVITDQRVIDMDTNIIALKSAREVDLLAIAAVEHKRGGGIFFGGLNRGEVAIRVIGEDDYYIPNAPMPTQVAQVIRELVEMEQKNSINSQNIIAAL